MEDLTVYVDDPATKTLHVTKRFPIDTRRGRECTLENRGLCDALLTVTGPWLDSTTAIRRGGVQEGSGACHVSFATQHERGPQGIKREESVTMRRRMRENLHLACLVWGWQLPP